jgi:creatinine amidohydrolase
MTAFYLDRMTWLQISEHIRSGRDTVIVPFGSTEQHGRHLPLGTDAVLGDELGWRLAERLDAFVAPTLRFGCSDHHMSFAGTISLTEETFRGVVKDVVRSLCKHGFKRIILMPTHGGNFQPLKKAFRELGATGEATILAFTDLEGLTKIAFKSSGEFGVDQAKSGAHAGEWETSIMLALRPEQVDTERAYEGFVGDLAEVFAKIATGLENLDKHGVIGDPRVAKAEAGRQYIEDMVDFLHRWVREQEGS